MHIYSIFYHITVVYTTTFILEYFNILLSSSNTLGLETITLFPFMHSGTWHLSSCNGLPVLQLQSQSASQQQRPMDITFLRKILAFFHMLPNIYLKQANLFSLYLLYAGEHALIGLLYLEYHLSYEENQFQPHNSNSFLSPA